MEKDGRLKKLVLTEKGRNIHEQHIDDIDLLEERCKRNIAPEELEVFLAVAGKLKENLEADIACSDFRLFAAGNQKEGD